MQDTITLYHGSSKIIEKPKYGFGNIHNDYGLAFYCTKNMDMAKEWAVTDNNNGYANEYILELTGLKILDLTNETYSILNWIAVLLENRVFRLTNIAKQGKEYILDKYLPSYNDYDVIKGYRADDSYFSFANAFLNNTLPLEKLDEVMRLGELGIQYAIKSRTAINRLKFIDAYDADKLLFYPSKKQRDENARNQYRDNYKDIKEGTFLIDIIRKGNL